ncbi:DsrE family protein [Hymenobacter sp. H14-R3]|uniref:DsrE family protein n=1 Tax=Hymenobacter sp. H14-R3 TaxID=3046308 RepID=UPI0024B9493A|nr:DsrE family protein [Hymenobacter sp. H14-R3]MDJ0367597.1 DsrE family protein [Hymenobacter sp. H14-R3]
MKPLLHYPAPAAALLLALLGNPSQAQTAAPAAPMAPAPTLGAPNAAAAAQAARFHGATARKGHYRAVYQLNSSDPKLITKTLQAMQAAVADPRLKGKLALELVVFSGGTVALRKNQPYEADVLALQQAGVILAQCENSMKAQNLTPDEMLPYISFVPTANGELIIRQAEGWALVHL